MEEIKVKVEIFFISHEDKGGENNFGEWGRNLSR